MPEDAVVLVTNVSRYVGPAAVAALAEEGAKLVCHDERFVNAAVREEWAKAHPGMTVLKGQMPADVVAESLAVHGRLDVVVSNDEFPAIRAAVDDAKLEDLRASLEAMVVRPFALAQAVVPHMKRQGHGRILLVTSAAPLRGLANYSMYATARGAANALMLTLARELATHQIVVNAVAPNYVMNPSYFPPELLANPEAMAKMQRNIPLGRLGKPEEVGAVIAFFCLGDCAFITGHVVPIAGGWA